MIHYLARVIAHIAKNIFLLMLCISFLISSCSGDSLAKLSGNYVEDTISVSKNLRELIELPQEEGRSAEVEKEARVLINEYMSRYRPKPQINGLSSFTTMQTALNSLAGHYANYTNRPLPSTLQERLTKELEKAERAVARGN